MSEEVKPLPIKLPNDFLAKNLAFGRLTQSTEMRFPSSSGIDLSLLAQLGLPIGEQYKQELNETGKERSISRDKAETSTDKVLDSPDSEDMPLVGTKSHRNGGKVRPSGRPPKYLADANVMVDILDDSPHGYVETTPHIRKLRQNLATQQCRLNRERNVRSIIFKFSEIVERWRKESKTSECKTCSPLFEEGSLITLATICTTSGIDDEFLAMLRDEVEREKKRLERKQRVTEIASSTATVRHLLT